MSESKKDSDEAPNDSTSLEIEESTGAPGLMQIETQPWNQEKAREDARAWIAFILLALLGFVAIGSGVGIAAKLMTVAEAKDYLGWVFTPLIGLVGPVVGFYYGGSTKQAAARAGRNRQLQKRGGRHP